MRLRRRNLFAIPLLLLSACSRRSQKPGPGLLEAGAARRIISLSPGTTEALFAIGAGDRLVGRSRYCDHPAAAKKLPSVGGFIDPSLEAILGLSPDLVVGVMGPGGPKIAEQLRQRGIQSYFPPTDSVAQIQEMIVELGKRLDLTKPASRVSERVAKQRRSVERALAGKSRPKAILLFGLRPIVVAGKGGFADEVLRLAGATNAVTADRYPTLGIEQVLALDPDVLVDATGAAGHEGETIDVDTPGFRELRAVKEKRLISIRDDRVLRPGPRIGEGLVVLAKALHPGLELGDAP